MRSLFLIPALLLASPALAASWAIDPASTLTFTGDQAGDAFTGSFSKFTPLVAFDPKKPEAGSITVTIDMTSATIAGDKEKNESLPGDEWLDSKKFPTATFTSTKISQVGRDTNTFAAEGELSLHGVKKPVQLSFTFNEQGGTATVDGTATLMRNDFNIGQGQWSDDKWVAYPVTVHFHLLAKPQ
jgi:polyisoprenoid-binding protein YceI